MAKRAPGKTSEPRSGIEKRLDALIRLFIEQNKPEQKKNITEGDIARLLKSVDLTPTEIAKILGKKSATDIATHLYAKKAISKKKGKANAEG